MAKSREHLPSQDISMSSTSSRSREWEGPSRWTEYLSPDITFPATTRATRTVGHDEEVQSTSGSQQSLNMHRVVQVNEVAEGLMAKTYRLSQIIDYPDPVNHLYTESIWKPGLFPNHPRICLSLSKKFPEHLSKLQLEHVDKVALDAMHDDAKVHLQNLEPWIQLRRKITLQTYNLVHSTS